MRECSALKIIEGLNLRSATVRYDDPNVPSLLGDEARFGSDLLTAIHMAAQDCVLVLTDHAEGDYQAIVESTRLVVATRHATRTMAASRATIVHL